MNRLAYLFILISVALTGCEVLNETVEYDNS